ncbi:phosphotransferase [Microbacterium sp. NPDC055683]
MSDEEILSGGNMGPVVRVGDTVRRVAGPWTPAVHDLLRECEKAGVHRVPRPLGSDDQGREILSYVDGRMMSALPPGEMWRPDLLTSAAVLLRRIHDAGVPLVASRGPWRQPAREPAEVICHNDFAPYNLVVSDDGGVGAIDFDMASPGSRVWDVAYLAYRLAPFAEDAPGHDVARDGSREARVAALVAAYGGSWAHDDIRAEAARRLDALAAFTDDRAESTGRADFVFHAGMYRRDAARLRRRRSQDPFTEGA